MSASASPFMTFLWPNMLWAMLVVPALIALYVFLVTRRKKTTLRYANLGLVREALGRGGAWRRHVPPLLMLLAISALLFAASRPAALITLPSAQETIVLAMDVSGSMRAADVKPNRLAAAQAAAKEFIADQPRSVRIGVVSFAATASIVQYPTQNREDLLNAIDRFQVQRGTAVGSAIIVSLVALFPDAGIDVSEMINGPGGSRRFFGGRNSPKKEESKPVPPGSYNGGAIILLSDGERTAGPEVLEAAKKAAERGVRVYTVGIGTTKGETIGFEGWSMRVKLDEESLKQIANITHGQYFQAASAADLKKVYAALTSRLTMEKKETEIGALFALAAAFFAMLAAGLSLWWFNRIL